MPGAGRTSGVWKPLVPGVEQPPAELYDPVTNPHGARCSIKDYHVNEIGTRSQDGFAYQVFDSIGLQYGLKALEAGSVTPEQFVDLNENVGGMDIDGNWQPQRTSGDVNGIANMYRSGLIAYRSQLGKYNSERIFTRNRIFGAMDARRTRSTGGRTCLQAPESQPAPRASRRST